MRGKLSQLAHSLFLQEYNPIYFTPRTTIIVGFLFQLSGPSVLSPPKSTSCFVAPTTQYPLHPLASVSCMTMPPRSQGDLGHTSIEIANRSRLADKADGVCQGAKENSARSLCICPVLHCHFWHALKVVLECTTPGSWPGDMEINLS